MDPTLLPITASGGQPSGFLLLFEAISGLRVNPSKRKMMAVGFVPNLVRLANILGCSVSMAPGTYLGLSLKGRLKFKLIWDPVVERVDKKQARWKGCYLSKGGRMTLIKSSLQPTIVLHVSHLGSSLERIRADFSGTWKRVAKSSTLSAVSSFVILLIKKV